MEIKQWEDKHLAHFSYAVRSECENKIVLIDPARNLKPYLEYAEKHKAQIVGVIETHPHADFVSSHLEIHQYTGATIYTSRRAKALYPHQPFDEGDVLELGKIKLHPLNTPGHSPDSISIVVEHKGKQKAVFTGDTLFIGDCGRPDLGEQKDNTASAKNQLAHQMYHSLRDKLLKLPDEMIVYPAHGAGSLCGKSLSEAHSSTIKEEKQSNWSLQPQSEEEFVKRLLQDQPFVPAYFSYNIAINKQGAEAFRESTEKVKIGNPITKEEDIQKLNAKQWIIDVRDDKEYKKGHLPQSINLMDETKFDTWLGSIIIPGEKFYLGAESEKQLKKVIKRAAAIGYEPQIEEAFVVDYTNRKNDKLDINEFKNYPNHYTIVDVRNTEEVQELKIFPGSLSIPLAELRNRISDIPTEKPIVVHCSGGYRSAAGSSMIDAYLHHLIPVFDLGEKVEDFIKEKEKEKKKASVSQ